MVKKKKQNQIKNKGFTLIELLVTIAIVAVIAGISFSVYQNSINKSKEKITLLAINNVKEAAILYSKEHYADVMWLTLYENDDLSGNNEEPTKVHEEDVKTSDNTCDNCGADISPEYMFCSECGTQINNN